MGLLDWLKSSKQKTRAEPKAALEWFLMNNYDTLAVPDIPDCRITRK